MAGPLKARPRPEIRVTVPIDVPACSSCERAIIFGEPIARAGRVYCRPCLNASTENAVAKRDRCAVDLLETARAEAFGAASAEDLLASARDYAAAYREEEGLRT